MIDIQDLGHQWLRDNLHCSPSSLQRLEYFAQELLAENQRQNLIARADADNLWWRHIVDSAQLLRVSRGTLLAAAPWLDLGTGAGFPGLVAAILEPGRSVVLVEQRRRRTEWLTRMTAELSLTNVSIEARPLAKVPSFAAAVISARAFAPLAALVNQSARFSTVRTLWLLPKGAKARQEVEGLPEGLQSMFCVEPSVTNPEAGIIVGRGAADSCHFGGKAC